MHGRPLRRATALAFAAVLIFAGTAFADQLLADGDVLNPGIQGTKPLPDAAPGAVVTVDVEFTLNCVGIGHVDVGQTVGISWSGSGSAPLGGAIVSVTSASIGPITDGWGVDGQGCPSPVPSMVGATRSTVTLRAPTTPANGYMYTIVYDRLLSPANPSDANAFSRSATQVSFSLNVVGNTPPTLTVPASLSVAGNTTGGWSADWSGHVSATDPEDNPDPIPSCEPVAGEVLPVGTTKVTCSVTDSGGLTTSASFDVTVTNTAPNLTVPASFTVEGNTTGGWTADWSGTGVSATDPEDNPDPTPTCDPPAGRVVPLGLNSVSCSVSDSAGASATGGFEVMVVDTTDPVLHDVPGDRSVTTRDPNGVAVTYTPPTATDVVDTSPSVDCSRPSGETFPVGITTVTCTATDGSRNSTSASFTVVVRYAAPHVASAIWLEPVGDGQDAFVANHSRTIPVKVRLFVNGVERSSGQAQLTLTPCDGGAAALELPLEWGGGRWNASLDTSMLPGNCYTVAASIDGLVAGSLRLELRGDPATTRAKTSKSTPPLPKKTGQLKPR
jgi:hypothetical protein